MKKACAVVSIISRVQKTRDLNEEQRQLDLPQHKLKQDVSKRQGSTYQMVAQLLEQQQAISARPSASRMALTTISQMIIINMSK